MVIIKHSRERSDTGNLISSRHLFGCEKLINEEYNSSLDRVEHYFMILYFVINVLEGPVFKCYMFYPLFQYNTNTVAFIFYFHSFGKCKKIKAF